MIVFSGEKAKSKWTNIRDAFSNNSKKAEKKSGAAAGNFRKYKYADILGFLLPYIKHRQTSGNLTTSSQTPDGSDKELGSEDEDEEVGSDDGTQRSEAPSPAHQPHHLLLWDPQT